MKWSDFLDMPESNSGNFVSTAPGVSFLDNLFGGALSRASARRSSSLGWGDLLDEYEPEPTNRAWRINQDYLEEMDQRQRRADEISNLRREINRKSDQIELNYPETIGVGALQGLQDLKQAGGGIAQAFGATQTGRRLSDEARQASEGLDTESDNLLKNIVQGLSRTAISMLPAVAGSAVGAGVGVGLGARTALGMLGAQGAAGLQTFGQMFDDAKRSYEARGYSPGVAQAKAYIPSILGGALTSYLTGRFGPHGAEALARGGIAWTGVRDAIRTILKEAGGEATEEGLDQLGQGIIEKASYNPEKPIGDIVMETVMAAAAGGILGGAVPATQQAFSGLSSISRAARRNQPVVEPQDQAFDVPAAEPQTAAGQSESDAPDLVFDPQLTELMRQAKETDIGQPGAVTGVEPDFVVPTVSRARDNRRRAGVGILSSLGISPDVASRFTEQFLASNPDVTVGEDFRNQIIRAANRAGLESEQSNLFREDPEAYVVEFGPEQARQYAEQARQLNQQKIEETRQRNLARIEGGVTNAIETTSQPENRQLQYQQTETGGIPTETGGGDSAVQGRPVQPQAQPETVTPAAQAVEQAAAETNPAQNPFPTAEKSSTVQNQKGGEQTNEGIEKGLQGRQEKGVLTQTKTEPGEGAIELAPSLVPVEQNIFFQSGKTASRGGVQYISESRELADKFSEGGTFGRPGAKVRQLEGKLKVFDAKLSGDKERSKILGQKNLKYIEPDGYLNWEAFERDASIKKRLKEAGYDAIRISEGEENGISIAVLEGAYKKLKETQSSPLTASVVAEPAAAPSPVSKSKKLATDVTNILDYMEVNGIKIKSRSQASEANRAAYSGVYDDLSKKTSMRKFFATKKGEGVELDEALDNMRRNGDAPGIKEESTEDDLWDLIDRAHQQRSKRQAVQKEEKARISALERQLIAFHEVALENKGRDAVSKKKAQPILVENFSVGDEFTLKGEKIRVIDMDIEDDPEAGEFRVKTVYFSDGEKFGKNQSLSAGQVVYADKNSLKEMPVEFVPEEQLNKPDQPAAQPRLRPMENQGDLISGQREDFALAQETGTDFERIQKQKEQSTKDKAEQEKKQQTIQASYNPDVISDLESNPVGMGRGLDGMRELLIKVGPQMQPMTRLVWENILNSPVMQDLNWDNLITQLWDGKSLEDGMVGIRMNNMIRMIVDANPDVLPHELAHVFFDFLPDSYRGWIEKLRLDAVRSKYGEAAPQSLLDGTMTSEEFRSADGISVDDYSLINASEFFARFVGQKFADETFAGRNIEKTLWLKVRNWVVAFMDAIKRAMGLNPTLDRAMREVFAGVWKPTPESIAGSEEWEGSFSYNEAEARNAARLVVDPEERAEQADDQNAQAQDIAGLLTKHGAGLLGYATRKILSYTDYLGIAQAGQDLNNGIAETYKQIKERLAQNLDPRAFEYRIKELARLAGKQIDRFENRLRTAIEDGAKAIKELESPRVKYLMSKVSEAQMDKLNAEVVEKTTKSVFDTALAKAYKALEEESRDDLKIAQLQARINELSAAEQSSTAMQQLMQDIISVLSSDPQGQSVLDGENFEPQPNPATPALTKDPIELYRQLKQERDEPMFSDSLLRWAFFILKRNRKLRDQLYAAHLYQTAPGIEAQMNSFQSRIAMGIKTDPVKTIRQMMRDREKAVSKKEKAKFVYLTLNKELEEVLDGIGIRIDAAETARQVIDDPAFQELAVEVRRDGGFIGTQKPLLTYVDHLLLLPSGRQLDVNPERIVGQKDLWEQTSADYQSGIDELKEWLHDPMNLDHPNYEVHRRNLTALEQYYHGQSLNRPNDPIGVWKYSLYIVNNAIKSAGGRMAAGAKRATAAWDRIRQRTGWWNQEWSKKIADSRIKALKSHGYKWGSFGAQTLTDANNLWWNTVGNELAASWAKGQRGHRAGSVLSTGETVTAEDMADLKTMADATSAGFKIVESEQFTEDALGDAISYRKAAKSSDYMTTREFNQELRETVGKTISEARKDWLSAKRSGDEELSSMARENLARRFNQFWPTIGRGLVFDRNPDFAKATAYDGEGRPFELIKENLKKNKNYLGTIEELFSEIESFSGDERVGVEDTVLDEFSRIVQNWYNEAKSDNEGTIGTKRAQEQKNHFSRARLKALAPFVFYEYGFKNTSRSIASFGNAIHQRAMDRMLASLIAIESDIDRQTREFQAKTDNLRRQGLSKAEKRVIDANAMARRNGETFDNYKNLERRRKLISDIIQSLTANENFDAEGNITVGRTVGALTGWLVSGIITTARNLTSGPRYLGWYGHAMVGSGWKSYPMAAWYTWIDQMLFRTIPTVAVAAVKTPYYLTIDFFKALRVLQNPERSLGMFTSKWFYRALTELGESMQTRLNEVAKMRREGIQYVDDAALDFQNRVLGSMLTQGRIFHRNFGTGEKIGQILPTIMELIVTFPRTFSPAFGDVTLNAATSKFTRAALGMLQERLAAMTVQPGFESRFNFQNINDPTNIISSKEFSNGKASEQDLFRLRGVFEGAGLNFDEEVVKFFAARQNDPQAQFVSDEDRLKLVESAINSVNRPSPSNSPLNLKEKNLLTAFIAPLMHWKTRMFSNFLGHLEVPATLEGKVSSVRDLLKQRAFQWALLLTTVLLPMLLLGGIGAATGEEELARVMKNIMYNQVNATRQPWERDTLQSKVIGFGLSASFGIPFLDMAVNAAINDLPNRASVDPSLVMVEKLKDTGRYMAGAIQTHDLTYKLPEFIGGLLPDTKIFLNRLDSQEGKREGANAVALIRRFGPTDMLRPMGGDSGVNANALSPMGARLENALLRGDMAEFRELVDETKRMAEQMGIADPDKRVKQMILARSPYNRALKAKLTEGELNQFKARLSPSELALIEDVEAKFTQAAEVVDARFSPFKKEPGSTSTSIGGGPTLADLGLGTGRVPGISRSRRRFGRRSTGLAGLSRSRLRTRRSRLSLPRRRSRVTGRRRRRR